MTAYFLPGNSDSFTIIRDGDDLVITSNESGFGAHILNHFADAGRVETFEFTDGVFGSSQIDHYLESGSWGGGSDRDPLYVPEY